MSKITRSSQWVLIDGGCNLCNSLAHYISRRDKKNVFQFVALESEKGQMILDQMGLHQHAWDSLIYVSGGHYFLKSDAVLHLLVELGRAWRLAGLGLLMPGSWRDWAYDWIARRRYAFFGRNSGCALPSDRGAMPDSL